MKPGADTLPLGGPSAGPAARERMSSVDAAWWRMDRPHNPMVIVGVLRLRHAVTLKALRGVIGERLLVHARFRQRPVHHGGADYWEFAPRFRLERHVTRLVLEGPGGDAELEALVGQRVAQGFDAEHPLWEMTLVKMAGGARTLLLRIHHCYADGLALVRLLAEVTAADPAASLAVGTGPAAFTPGGSGEHAPSGLLDELLSMAALATRPGADGASVSSAVAPVLARITEGVQAVAGARAAELTRFALALGTELVRLAEMPDETPTPFKGKPGALKCIAWGDALPTDQARQVARAFGCSINAVLLSCVAAALGAQLRLLGADPRQVEIRVLLPSPLRSVRRASAQSGNHFGLVNLALPLGIGNPVARAWEVHRRIEALAGTRQAQLMHLLLGVVGLLPGDLQTRALDLLSSKATAVITTVPGPPVARYLAGARIDDIMFWVPQAGDIGLGISILSYDGRFRIGLMSDSALLPQPRQVLDGALAELGNLLPLAQVMAQQQSVQSATTRPFSSNGG
ncbi:MAG TPA: WS/DGAT domain-containing protein [Rubrivivax sp.]|nr:WS/DGAT domain-containing protein [Rubrivivax sp.]